MVQVVKITLAQKLGCTARQRTNQNGIFCFLDFFINLLVVLFFVCGWGICEKKKMPFLWYLLKKLILQTKCVLSQAR